MGNEKEDDILSDRGDNGSTCETFSGTDAG